MHAILPNVQTLFVTIDCLIVTIIMDNDSDATRSSSTSPVSDSNDMDLEPVPASSPFDGPDGDVILRTSDSVDFRVIKAILALASPVFNTMFTLPQPTGQVEESLPIVSISESSATVDMLLRLCYPVESPPLAQQGIAIIGDVLGAALKYDIGAVIGPARKALRKCAETSNKNAIAAYAIACHLKLEDEARAAAMACLKWPFPGPVSPQLVLMSGLDYYNLLEFHRKAGEATVSLFQKNRYNFVMDTCAGITPHTHSCLGSTCLSYTIDGEGVDVTEYLWWSSSKSVLSEAFRRAPLATDKLSLSTLAPALEASECHRCKNKLFYGWEETREAIISAMKKKIAKVELVLSWK